MHLACSTCSLTLECLRCKSEEFLPRRAQRLAEDERLERALLSLQFVQDGGRLPVEPASRHLHTSRERSHHVDGDTQHGYWRRRVRSHSSHICGTVTCIPYHVETILILAHQTTTACRLPVTAKFGASGVLARFSPLVPPMSGSGDGDEGGRGDWCHEPRMSLTASGTFRPVEVKAHGMCGKLCVITKWLLPPKSRCHAPVHGPLFALG